MENLLEETIEKLTACGKTPKDVLWIGTSDGKETMTWEEFSKLANFEYNDGYGSIKIRPDLVVMGIMDWWLERHEYDGEEWWEFKEKPKLKLNPVILTRLRANAHDQHL